MSTVLTMAEPIAAAAHDAGDPWAIETDADGRRHPLPAPPGARAWRVVMTPGSAWPRAERTETGEIWLVLDGEAIEGDARYPAGTQIVFAPGSLHRLRTEIGARLFGFGLDIGAYLGAGGDPAALSGQLHVQQG